MAFPLLRHALSAEAFALETISRWISLKHNHTIIKSSSYKEIKAQVKDHYHASSNGAACRQDMKTIFLSTHSCDKSVLIKKIVFIFLDQTLCCPYSEALNFSSDLVLSPIFIRYHRMIDLC